MNIMRSPILPDEFEMDRDEAEAAVGEFLETPEGRQALIAVVEDMGFAALTDEALIELAIKHWHHRQKILGD